MKQKGQPVKKIDGLNVVTHLLRFLQGHPGRSWRASELQEHYKTQHKISNGISPALFTLTSRSLIDKSGAPGNFRYTINDHGMVWGDTVKFKATSPKETEKNKRILFLKRSIENYQNELSRLTEDT